MIEIKQKLSEDDYRKAASAHYNTYKMSKVRPVLVFFLIASGIYLCWINSQIIYAIFCIAYGIFMMFRKYIYVYRVVKSVKTTKLFGELIEIKISDDDVFESRQGSDTSKIELKNLFGYLKTNFGVLLYPQKNMFYLLKANVFNSADQIEEFMSLLETSNVKIIKE